jgi:hypothetical protein
VARALRKLRVAVDGGHRVGDRGVEALGDGRRERVVGGEELLFGDPDALDEVERRARMAPVVGGQRVVELRAHDRVDAHHARPEVVHAVEPAVVVRARGGQLAGMAPGHRDAEVHPGPEAAGEAALEAERQPLPLDAGGQLHAAAPDRRAREEPLVGRALGRGGARRRL